MPRGSRFPYENHACAGILTAELQGAREGVAPAEPSADTARDELEAACLRRQLPAMEPIARPALPGASRRSQPQSDQSYALSSRETPMFRCRASRAPSTRAPEHGRTRLCGFRAGDYTQTLEGDLRGEVLVAGRSYFGGCSERASPLVAALRGTAHVRRIGRRAFGKAATAVTLWNQPIPMSRLR